MTNTEYVKIWRMNNPDKARELWRKDWHRRKHDPKVLCRQKTKYYVRAGKLISSPYCEYCGNFTDTMAHHTNYKQPLNVQWFCKSCHKLVHDLKLTVTILTAHE